MLKEDLVEILGDPSYDSKIQKEFVYNDLYDQVLDRLAEKGILLELVEDVGGEGCGDTYYKVWKFTRNQEVLYISFNAWYASYEGATYEDYSFVKPVTKTVTVYE